jgi:hypothetical protein
VNALNDRNPPAIISEVGPTLPLFPRCPSLTRSHIASRRSHHGCLFARLVGAVAGRYNEPMNTSLFDQVRNLPLEEQLELVEALWDSIGGIHCRNRTMCGRCGRAAHDVRGDWKGCSPCRCQSVSIQRVLSSGRATNRRFGGVPRKAQPRHLAGPDLSTDR